MKFKELKSIVVDTSNIQSYVSSALIHSAVHDDMTLYEANIEGYTEDPKVVSKIIEENGYKVLSVKVTTDADFGSRFYIREDVGMIAVEEYVQGYLDVEICSSDVTSVFTLLSQLKPMLKVKAAKGVVKMLAQGPTGYHVMDVGKVNCPLDRKNYTETVLNQYDHIVKEMTSSTPCGRFSMLTGPPGTGKSYLLRGLISEVPKVRWLFIPSYLVGSLSGPGLSQVLFQSCDNLDAPLVIILEDADSSVKKRQGGNADQISDLLNLGDGILGEIADIRVIATINAKTQEIDEALVRPGRLCQSVNFNYLSTSEWEERFKGLTGDDASGNVPPENERSLAHLYRKARDAGWKNNSEDIVVKSPATPRGLVAYDKGQYV